jgi:ABC-type sugar transport system substrate-binding protein
MRRTLSIAIVLLVCMSVAAFADGFYNGRKLNWNKPETIVIGMIPITLDVGYHQAEVKNAIAYAKEKYGVTVKVISGDMLNDKAVAGVDTFLAEGVAGIMLHAGDGAVLDAAIKEAHSKKVPILTFYNMPGIREAPHVSPQEQKASYQMGVWSVQKWKEFHPTQKKINYAVIEFMNIEHVQIMRSKPWIEGVMATDPAAKLVSMQDGAGSTEKAMKVMQDMIQAHPEINVVYGTNASHGLGALAALEATGRGKAKKGVPTTEFVEGTDADLAEMVKIYNPNNSFKITQGQKAVDNSRAKIDTMVKMLKGELDPYKWVEVPTYNVPISYYDKETGNIAWGQKWLQEQFLYTGDLAKDAGVK